MLEFLNWDGPSVTVNGESRSFLGYDKLNFEIANRRKKQLSLITPFESWSDLGVHSYSPFINFITDTIQAYINISSVYMGLRDFFFDSLQEGCDEDEAEIKESRHSNIASAGAAISSIAVVPLYIVAQLILASITAVLTAISFLGRLLATALNLGFQSHKELTLDNIAPEVFEKVKDKDYYRLFTFRQINEASSKSSNMLRDIKKEVKHPEGEAVLSGHSGNEAPDDSDTKSVDSENSNFSLGL